MKNLSLDYKKLIICFFLYSIIGWLYEVFLEVVIYQWGFTNRGVLFGPYCPIYGFGATIFVLLFYKYKTIKNEHPIIKIISLFLGCMFIATFIELIASYILEFFIGHWLWQTYADYAINFQGRIALSPSIRFGLGGLLFLYIIQPLFDKILNKCNPQILKIITCLILIIFSIDCLYTFI